MLGPERATDSAKLGLDDPFDLSWIGIGITFAHVADRFTEHRAIDRFLDKARQIRSEEHTSDLQSLMRNSYAVFCLKKKKSPNLNIPITPKDNTTQEHLLTINAHNKNKRQPSNHHRTQLKLN